MAEIEKGLLKGKYYDTDTESFWSRYLNMNQIQNQSESKLYNFF